MELLIVVASCLPAILYEIVLKNKEELEDSPSDQS